MKTDADKVDAFTLAVRSALRMINDSQNDRYDGKRVKWMEVTAAITEELHWALGVCDIPQDDPGDA